MNACFRMGPLMAAALFTTFQILAQPSEEDLRVADKQYELAAYNLALNSYLKIQKSDPGNTHTLARIGDCYNQLNRPEDAVEWYEKATSNADVQPIVLLNMGKAQMETGNYTEAKRWFLQYAESDAKVGKHFYDNCTYAAANLGKDPLYKVRNEPLNTTFSDFSPEFFGKNLVYNSARTDIARKSKSSSSTENWSGEQYNQLFITQKDGDDGMLQKPRFLKSDIGNSYNEGPVTYAENGKKVVFCRNNFLDGTRQIASDGMQMSMYYADVEDGSWANIKPFPHNGSDFATGFPCLSPDGKTLYFASNRPGFGGWDLFSSTWTGSSWSTPENLGPEVNSPGNEITPFIEGETLYFSSDWHPGFGGLDIFRAEKSRQEWAKIFHLGPGVNSSRDDYGFIFDKDENIGYFTSTRKEGRGNEDIWQVRRKTDDFIITVVDGKGKPVPGANVDFSACKGGEFTTNEKGIYAFSVALGQANCQAKISKTGFETTEIAVKSGGETKITVSLEADNQAIFTGKIIDATTQKGLADVEIRGLPMPKGDVLNATSDINGKYSLKLEPKKTYKITYSKEGYVDFTISLETSNAKKQNEMSPVELLDVKSAAIAKQQKMDKKEIPAKPEEKETKSEAPQEYAQKTEVKPIPAKVEKMEKSTAKEAVVPEIAEKKVLVSGFAVQVGTVPGKSSPAKLKPYESLADLGNIYTQATPKMTKIKVGVFNTRKEADAAAVKARARKFKGAFVLAEPKADKKLLIENAVAGPVEKPVVPAKPAENKEEPATKADLKDAVRFAVQIASLTNDGSAVNMATYADLFSVGNVYTLPENEYTKIRVGVWERYLDADIAKDFIEKKGFKGAIVVAEKSLARTEKMLIKKEKNNPKTESKLVEKSDVKGGKKTDKTAKGEEGAEKPVAHSIMKSTPSEKAASVSSIYKVRIATYDDADYFDPTSVSGVNGQVERQKIGKKTIILLSGYKDLEEAINAKRVVRDMGYPDAHVVKDKGEGNLMRLKL